MVVPLADATHTQFATIILYSISIDKIRRRSKEGHESQESFVSDKPSNRERNDYRSQAAGQTIELPGSHNPLVTRLRHGIAQAEILSCSHTTVVAVEVSEKDSVVGPRKWWFGVSPTD